MQFSKAELKILKESKTDPILVVALTPTGQVVMGALSRNDSGHLLLDQDDVKYRSRDTEVARKNALEIFEETVAQMGRWT